MYKLFIIFSYSLVLFSCKKDEELPTLPKPQGPEKTLLDNLAGVYNGYRYLEMEDIQCVDLSGGLGLDCQNCNSTYTYDTILLNVEVLKENEYEIQVFDKYDGLCDHLISMDSSLFFNGLSPNTSAPINNYKLWFAGENYDSLYIDIVEGGGGACTATYYRYDYILTKN